MKTIEQLIKDVMGSVKEMIDPVVNMTESEIGMGKKKIEVELPEPPSSGGFAGCPSGDNDYDDAMKRWRQTANAIIVKAIPDGYDLKSSEIKETKVVRHFAEIVVEKR